MMAVLLWGTVGAVGVGLMVALLFGRALARALAHVRAGEQRYRHMFEKNPAIKLLIDPTSGAIIEGARARWRDPRRRVDPAAQGGVRSRPSQPAPKCVGRRGTWLWGDRLTIPS